PLFRSTLTATAFDASSNPIAGATFTWRSDDTGKATVSSLGVVTAVGNGTAHIFAKTTNNVENTVGFAVTVSQAVATVNVSQANPSISAGSYPNTTQQFTPTAKDARGNSISPPPPPSWECSN